MESGEPFHTSTRRSLSRYFDPFVDRFVDRCLATGGEVWAAREGSEIHGVFLYSPAERTGSILARDRGLQDRFFRWGEGRAIFAETPLAPAPERYHVMERDLTDWRPSGRPRYPTRLARSSDAPGMRQLLHHVHGPFDDRYTDLTAPDQGAWFVAEQDGVLLGAAGADLAVPHARLHALSVHPRYRRLGVGKDLRIALVRWAQQAGATHLLSEIAEDNVASLALSESEGMRRAGEVYLSRLP